MAFKEKKDKLNLKSFQWPSSDLQMGLIIIDYTHIACIIRVQQKRVHLIYISNLL